LIRKSLTYGKKYDNFLDFDVWVREEKLEELISAINKHSQLNEHSITSALYDHNAINNEYNEYKEYKEPPTFLKTNEFTEVHQIIVNTYGVPAYKEVNPALFNIVTFPFLFGIMFGDLGHGLILLSFSLILFYLNKIGSDYFPKEVITIRWFLLFLSISAIYTGIIYNEFFSITMDWGSCWKNKFTDSSNVIIYVLF
jgi:V-type H+-transporting ATPase subunit a